MESEKDSETGKRVSKRSEFSSFLILQFITQYSHILYIVYTSIRI